MLELAFDGLILAALFVLTPSASRTARLVLLAAVIVFVVRLVLAILGRV